jgi:hypothetical protein
MILPTVVEKRYTGVDSGVDDAFGLGLIGSVTEVMPAQA